ncbi:MAG: glycosyltransferase [Pseudomonadota bacterium]
MNVATALISKWQIRLSRLSAGLSRAYQTHGLTGAIRKTWLAVRTRGPRGAMMRVVSSLRQHAASGLGHVQLNAFDAHYQALSPIADRPAPRPPRSPMIVIISDTTIPQCYRYRIENKLEYFRAQGVGVCFADANQPNEVISALQFASGVIFYRSMMDDAFMFYHGEAERLGLPTFYDIDDPMFDQGLIAQNANTEALEPAIQSALYRDAVSIRRAMASCDALLASTPDLASRMNAASGGKPAFVWRNVADQAALDLGDRLAREAANDQSTSLKIGYFSGSLAHEADFDIAAPALERLLASRDDVELLLFGHLGPRPMFDALSDRVTRHAVADYEPYLRAVAACDLVVVPLVDNGFNRCKSVVRFLDAALVQTPVMASMVGDYANLVRNDETGWLVTDDGWDHALARACLNAAGRHDIAQRARHFVETAYAVGSYAPALDAEHQNLLFGQPYASVGH